MYLHAKIQAFLKHCMSGSFPAIPYHSNAQCNYSFSYRAVFFFICETNKKKATFYLGSFKWKIPPEMQFICHTFIFNNIFIIQLPSMVFYFVFVRRNTTQYSLTYIHTRIRKKELLSFWFLWERKKIQSVIKLACAAIVINNCWISHVFVFVEQMFHFMAVNVRNQQQLIYLST